MKERGSECDMLVAGGNGGGGVGETVDEREVPEGCADLYCDL